MKAATAEADALQAELAELEAEAEATQKAVEEAEAKAFADEQELTSRTSAMLSEYTVAHARNVELEAEVASLRADLAMKRAENLEYARRNRELDRTTKQCREQVAEAEKLLEQCANSQGGFDKEIARWRTERVRLQEASHAQAVRFEADLTRFQKLRLRLLEVAPSSEGGSEGGNGLVAEVDKAIAHTKKLLEESQRAASEPVEPGEEDPPETEIEIATSAAAAAAEAAAAAAKAATASDGRAAVTGPLAAAAG